MKKVSQKYIDKISGNPELFERWCKRYNKNKDFSNLSFSNLEFYEKNFQNFDFSSSDFSSSNFSSSDFRFSDFSFSNFSYSNFSSSDFRSSNFSFNNFSSSNFSSSDFRSSNFRFSDFSYSNFSFSNFSYSNFSFSDFSSSDFSFSNFSSSDFSFSDFRSSNFRSSDFCNIKGIKNILKIYISIELKLKILGIEKKKNYYIAYKSFGDNYAPPKKWIINTGSIIKEHINHDIWQDCGKGINVASKKWCRSNYINNIWLIHIPFDSEICVPVYGDGKFRVSKCKLIKMIKDIK